MVYVWIYVLQVKVRVFRFIISFNNFICVRGTSESKVKRVLKDSNEFYATLISQRILKYMYVLRKTLKCEFLNFEATNCKIFQFEQSRVVFPLHQIGLKCIVIILNYWYIKFAQPVL